MTVRGVKLVRPARETLEGAGVHLRRAFGNGDETVFDPFLMLDDFRGDHPSMYQRGFPWHPHRGIETITYMIEGECDHGDSLGNQGTIRAGDVQWMTAGSGIVHQEMPRGNELGRMGGFQLWLNLPAVQKMTEPRYQGIEAAGIPTVEAESARVRVVAGRVEGVVGPIVDVSVEPEYLDVTLAPDAAWEHPTVPGFTVFAYVFEGTVRFGESGEPIVADPGRIVLLEDGGAVSVTAGREGGRFLLAAGRPLREPIAWRGPIVMNRVSELDDAWRELDQGTFIKHRPAGSRPEGGVE
jgi:redox-sensitive bicupin YhaK (pirin superfamily)